MFWVAKMFKGLCCQAVKFEIERVNYRVGGEWGTGSGEWGMGSGEWGVGVSRRGASSYIGSHITARLN